MIPIWCMCCDICWVNVAVTFVALSSVQFLSSPTSDVVFWHHNLSYACQILLLWCVGVCAPSCFLRAVIREQQRLHSRQIRLMSHSHHHTPDLAVRSNIEKNPWLFTELRETDRCSLQTIPNDYWEILPTTRPQGFRSQSVRICRNQVLQELIKSHCSIYEANNVTAQV